MSSADGIRSSEHKVPALRLARLMRPVFSALLSGKGSTGKDWELPHVHEAPVWSLL
jgi:hypothetical protein